MLPRFRRKAPHRTLPWLALVLAATPAFGITTPPPDHVLDRYNLAKDEESLLKYLAVGVPQSFPGPFQERFSVYRRSASKLGELNSTAAARTLVRLIKEPLPDFILDDLLAQVSFSDTHRSWKDWDFERNKAEAALRVDCAGALARIGDNASLPALLAYLESFDTLLELDASRNGSNSWLHRSFGDLCVAVTALGSNAGIEALIGRLAAPSPIGAWTIEDSLGIATGKNRGPTDYGAGWRQRVFEEWSGWWRENRESFQIEASQILDPPVSDTTWPAPTTIREHLKLTYRSDNSIGGGGPQFERSMAWVTEYAKSHPKRLRAIATDVDESAVIRAEALKWYARRKKFGALKLLTAYATGTHTPNDENDVPIVVRLSALGAIQDHYPKAAAKVAKRCLLLPGPIATSALRTLMQDQANHEYVAENFNSLNEYARRTAALYFHRSESPVGRKVFFEAIRDTNIQTAAYGIRGIDTYYSRADLPEATRGALESWLQDPEFRLLIIRYQAPSSTIFDALDLIQQPDAHAARVYSRAWRMLPEEDRVRATRGLLQCIAEYQRSRSL